MERLRIALLAALLVLSAALAPTVQAQGDAVFPVFKGKNLKDERVSTDAFRGKAWLIMVGFDRGQAGALREWAVQFRQAFPDEAKADYYQIAAMPGNLGFMRGFIHGQMKKGAPEIARGHIMAVYAADALCKQLDIKNRKLIHLFVLDAEGRITHRETGNYDPTSFERIRGKLQGLVAQAR